MFDSMFFNFFKKGNGLNAVYTMHSIQNFATALISVFVPIYFLILGHSLSEVLLYFLIYYLSSIVFCFLTIFLANKIGLVRTLIVRFPFLFIYLASIFLLKFFAIPLPVIAILYGLQSVLYWLPLNILFSQKTDNEKMGSSVSKLIAFPEILAMLAPAAGGWIIIAFDFNVLIYFACAIFALSLVPLIKHAPAKTNFSFKLSVGKTLFKKYRKYFLADMMENVGGETRGIIWPIFIYLNLINIAAVGAVATIVKAGSIIMTILVGKIHDKYKEFKLMKLGAVLLIFVWLGCYFATKESLFYILTILDSFFVFILVVPFTSLIFKVSKEHKIDEFLVFREISSNLGRIIIILVALIFVHNIKVSFLAASLSYLYFLFL